MTNLKGTKSVSVEEKRKIYFLSQTLDPKWDCQPRLHSLASYHTSTVWWMWVEHVETSWESCGRNRLISLYQVIHLLDLFKCWCSVTWIIHRLSSKEVPGGPMTFWELLSDVPHKLFIVFISIQRRKIVDQYLRMLSKREDESLIAWIPGLRTKFHFKTRYFAHLLITRNKWKLPWNIGHIVSKYVA